MALAPNTAQDTASAEPPGSSQRAGWALGCGLALLLAGLAGWQIIERGHSGTPLVFSLLATTLLFLPYTLFGLTNLPQRLRPRLSRHAAALPLAAAALLVPYLIYGLGTGTLSLTNLAIIAAFVMVPTAIVLATRKAAPAAGAIIAVLAIWLPFDFRWVQGLWTWPEGLGAYGLSTVLAVDVALLLFVAYLGTENVGYRLRWTRLDARVIVENTGTFALIAIPLGLAIGFIAFEPRNSGALSAIGAFLAIFMFIALPEEFLFRGLIQNFFEQRWGKNAATLGAAALIFGASHLNNGGFPNVKYFILATIAGVVYGRAFRQSGGPDGGRHRARTR